jgi:HemY protein
MKAGIYIAVAMLIGAALANMLLADPGYIAIRFAGHLVEMTAITFAVLLVAAYVAVRLMVRLVTARRQWKRAQVERREERARRSLSLAILELAEGQWESAESTATRYVRDAEHGVAHYLVAARAAELQGSAQRRDEWLARALDMPAKSHAPALIMQAELLLKHKQLQAAQTALEQLEQRQEQNARGLLLLARIYRQTNDWQKLQELEPRLRSTRGIETAVADETVTQIYLDRLRAAGATANPNALRSAWKDMPRSLCKRADMVVAYARAAMSCDEPDLAEKQLRELLDAQWDDAAVQAYGELETQDALQTLERAEAWLPQHQEDATLLLACARLSARAELYGKARSYLETSIAIRPRLDAYQLLADLMEQLGDRDRALSALTDALALAVGRKSKFPTIRQRRWLERRQGERRR